MSPSREYAQPERGSLESAYSSDPARKQPQAIERESIEAVLERSREEHLQQASHAARDENREIGKVLDIPAISTHCAGRGITDWGRFRLAQDSVAALRTTGIFGVVDCKDLAGTVFDSQRRARSQLQHLTQQGLLELERFRAGRKVLTVATVTRKGKRFLENTIDPRDRGDAGAQSYSHGPASDSRILHDTAVCHAALQEIRTLEQRGGLVTRILPERELQRQAWRQLVSARRNGTRTELAREDAASRLGLSIQHDKLVFPDVRIEARLAPDESGRVLTHSIDVEVATPDYRSSSLETKQAAGFRMYYLDAQGSLQAGSTQQ